MHWLLMGMPLSGNFGCYQGLINMKKNLLMEGTGYRKVGQRMKSLGGFGQSPTPYAAAFC